MYGPRRGAAMLAGLIMTTSGLVVGGGTAHADGQGTGPSGISYRIQTVCSTGEMQISTSDAPAGRVVTMTITSGSGLGNGEWEVGGTYSSASITVDMSVAMDPQGVIVKEDGVRVLTASYATQCGNFVRQQATAPRSAFTPVVPQRVLDTRPGAQLNYRGSKPAKGARIELSVVGGAAGVPANASAIVLNVTAVEATAPGYVQVFPTGRSTPGASSNLNIERAGQTIPNAVIVPVGDGGKVTLFTEAGTHLLADIAGYFAPVSGAVAAGRYVAIDPHRVLDTRAAVQLGYHGPKPPAGTRVTFDVAAPGAPPAFPVAAVALNLTATDATAPGFVQIAPAGKLTPGSTSSLNLERAGQTIANLVIVPVSADGTVELYTQGGTNLLADVVGYFTNADAVASRAGLFVPVTPERILDTRGTRLGAGEYEADHPGSVVKDFGGLAQWHPAGVVLNVTATNTTTGGYVQVGDGNSMVHGAHSNLNMEASQTIPNAVISSVGSNYPDSLEIYNDGAADLLADLAGWFTS